MRMQLDGPNLTDLLARAREEHGDGVQIVKADRIRTGGVAGFFSKERYQLTIEVPEHAAARDEDTPSLPSMSLLDLADAVSDLEREAASGSTQPKTSAGPTVSTDSPSFATILARLTESVAEPAPAPAVVAERAPVVQPVAVRIPQVRVTPPKTGLPALIDPLAGGGAEVSLRTLVGALRELPAVPALPEEAGNVIAVVGYDVTSAWQSAIALAERLGFGEETLSLASETGTEVRVPATRRIDAADVAKTRANKWRKRTTATIVVVDAPMVAASSKSNRWSRDVLEALEPDAVWAVVSATSKTHDAAAWVDHLPSCDALLVTDVEASADPASVLELGPPVAALDGRPATAGAWAGLIVERLLEAA